MSPEPTPVAVDSVEDPRVATFGDVRSGHRLRERGLFVVESRHAVRALLAASRFRVRTLWVTAEAWSGLAPLVAAAPDAIEVFVSPRELFPDVTGFAVHRGCVALAERGAEPGIEELPSGARYVVALERLADPANLGSAFRNAQAFGADAVVLAPGGADPLYRKCVRVSTGAALRVPTLRSRDWPADLGRLADAGFAVLAAVAAPDATDIAHFGRTRPIPERVCLVLGCEDSGLSAAAISCADECVTVRMARGFDSINVATASAILLHRLSRV